MQRNLHAFTLVEMSIVLAVIGLIIGGLVVGTNVIRASEAQAVTKDFGKYEGAVIQFIEQYGGWPGQITDATEYWGTDPSGCPSNSNLQPRKGTCDGTGAALLGSPNSFRAWQQLGNAGLVDGLFPGVAGSGGALHGLPGVNIPKGPINNTGYAFYGLGSILVGNANYYEGEWGNIIAFGVRNPTSLPWGGALKPSDTYNIDLKLDDGKPSTGKIATTEQSACSTTTDAATAEYAINSPSALCSIYLAFGTGF